MRVSACTVGLSAWLRCTGMHKDGNLARDSGPSANCSPRRVVRICCATKAKCLRRSTRAKRHSTKRKDYYLTLERLEDRWAPANLATITTLASFNGGNGALPEAGLILDNSGNLFGTASGGGPSGYGTVFEAAPGSSTITTLASFNSSSGANPKAGLVEDSSGNLFGTTYGGGKYNQGTVFEVANESNTITTLASFNGSNGANPIGGLALDTSGNLFGTTVLGGTSAEGTVFEVFQGSNAITTLASFNGGNGEFPEADLVLDKSGMLVGTTYLGGTSGRGTVFEVTPATRKITTLASFNGSNGAFPEAGLVEDSSGNLFGTPAYGGTSGDGTVFEVLRGSNQITLLATFNGSNGSWPTGLVLDSSGNLFGTTYFGGVGTRHRVRSVQGQQHHHHPGFLQWRQQRRLPQRRGRADALRHHAKWRHGWRRVGVRGR